MQCLARFSGCVVILVSMGMPLVLGQDVSDGGKQLLTQPFPFLPQGVTLGMSVGDFQKARPEAKRFHIATDAEAAGAKAPRLDMTKGEHVFLEQLREGSDFQVAGYVIKDGIVTAVTLGTEWSHGKKKVLPGEGGVQAAEPDFRTIRKRVFAECKARMGDDYSVEAVSVGRGDVVRYLAPRFSWVSEGVGLAFVCTSEYQDVDILEPFVSLQLRLVDKSPGPRWPHAEAVDAHVLSRLAQPVTEPTVRTK